MPRRCFGLEHPAFPALVAGAPSPIWPRHSPWAPCEDQFDFHNYCLRKSTLKAAWSETAVVRARGPAGAGITGADGHALPRRGPGLLGAVGQAPQGGVGGTCGGPPPGRQGGRRGSGGASTRLARFLFVLLWGTSMRFAREDGIDCRVPRSMLDWQRHQMATKLARATTPLRLTAEPLVWQPPC